VVVQGKQTPQEIIEFILREKMNAPALTQARLAARVEAMFGDTIDKSTIGRILRANQDRISRCHRGEQTSSTFDSSLGLGSHRRELFYFGQRLRDRLELLAPHQALNQWKDSSDELRMAVWSGGSAVPDRDPAGLSEEERNVEEAWESGPNDARSHPQFYFFREHLAGGSLWKHLERLKSSQRLLSSL
jgi:hypothetical protein